MLSVVIYIINVVFIIAVFRNLVYKLALAPLELSLKSWTWNAKNIVVKPLSKIRTAGLKTYTLGLIFSYEDKYLTDSPSLWLDRFVPTTARILIYLRW